MFPALYLKLIKGGSVLRVPLFWSLANLLILLSLCLFSLSGDLIWWLYIVMALSFFSLFRQEEWFYNTEKKTLTYRRGMRGWARLETFTNEEMEGISLQSLGRYWILVLKVGGRELELERSLRKTSLESLQNQLVKHWLLKRLD